MVRRKTVQVYFSERVPAQLMQRFMKESAHPIFELELLPVWCALVKCDPSYSTANFFSVRRLLGFRQVAAQVRLCISELCRNMQASFLQHSQCVVYIDNEAARGALTNGAASTEHGRQIVQDFVLKEMGYQ